MELGLLNSENRCWIEIRGQDSRKFLNGLLTNDINKLRGQTGCYALILTPKGKIIADCFCYTCGDYFGIDCAASLKPALMENLKKYIVFQKVSLEDQSDSWKTMSLLVLKENTPSPLPLPLLGGEGKGEGAYYETKYEGLKFWIIFKKLWGFPCYELWIKKEEAAELKNKLNLPEISHETQEVLRIESGTPLFGIDFNENTLPQEAGLYDAISFDKGCYVGQEIVARLEHRGHVGKQLVQLVIEGKTLPARGEKIFSLDGKEIGAVTSSCFSPAFNSALGLGFVRYQFLDQKEMKIGSSKAQIKNLVKDKVF